MAGKNVEEPKIEIPPESNVKPPEGYTEEEWMDLSDSEKEGIVDSLKAPEGEEEPAEEIDEDALKAIAGEEDEEKNVEKPEVKPKEAAAEQAKGAEAVEPEKKIETPSPVVPGERLPDDDLASFEAVVLESELPAVDTVPEEIQTKLDELDSKYDNGDIDLKQYNKERDSLNRQVTMANIRERESTREALKWQKEQNYFLQNRPEYLGEPGKEGKYEPTIKSRALFGALVQTVNALGKDPKYYNLSGVELMLVADKQVREAFGIVSPAKTPEKKVVEKKPPAPLPEGKTLSDIPSAAPNQTDSPFSALDKLSGAAYEAALERLTPAQRTQYEDDLARMGR